MSGMYNTAEKNEEELVGPQDQVTASTSTPETNTESEGEGEFDYSAFADSIDNIEEETELDTPEQEVEESGKGEEVEEDESQPTPQEDEGKKEEPEPETPGETEEGKKEEPEEGKKPEEEEEVYTPPDPSKVETPEEYQARLDAARKAARADLEKRYSLTEEEADEILSDPGKALPKQLARVYTDVYEQVLGDMKAMIPNMVQQVQQQEAVKEKGRSEFFGMFPELQGLDSEVEGVANAYIHQAQQSGKAISKQELFRKVGVQVSLMHNKPLPKGMLNGAELGTTETVEEEERPTPFTPANPGQPSSPTGAGQFNMPGNMWEELAVDEDDYGD